MTRYRFEWDFGFTALQQYVNGSWDDDSTPLEAVAHAAEDRADTPPGATASALLDDTLLLLESPLTSDRLTTLWLAGTRRMYDLERQGVDGRDWLRQIVDVCTARLRAVKVPLPVRTPPAPAGPGSARDSLADAVLGELADIGPMVTARTGSYLHHELSGVVPALRQAVTEVDPDLGFRMLLRTLHAYWVPFGPERFARYEALGVRFGYGEFHLDQLYFLSTVQQ